MIQTGQQKIKSIVSVDGSVIHNSITIQFNLGYNSSTTYVLKNVTIIVTSCVHVLRVLQLVCRCLVQLHYNKMVLYTVTTEVRNIIYFISASTMKA